MFTQITDNDLNAANGGWADPSAVTGMTKQQAITCPEEFQARFHEWRAEPPRTPGMRRRGLS